MRASDTGELIAGGDLLVGSAAPGLFTSAQSGAGRAAALNEGLSVNSSSNPAAAGSTIVVYGTGPRSGQPRGPDGGRSRLPSITASMCVAIGGAFGSVTYSGLAPGFVGLWQINVTILPKTPSGPSPSAPS